MFGPESGKNGWKDLTFVYDKVRIREEDICSNFLNIFASEVDCLSQLSSMTKPFQLIVLLNDE